MQDDFKAAAEDIKAYNIKSDDDLLELYALYKQANMGDNDTRACPVGGAGRRAPESGIAIKTNQQPLARLQTLQPSPGC